MSQESEERRKNNPVERLSGVSKLSLVIDGALALAILGAVWRGGQFVERMEHLLTDFEEMNVRVQRLESNGFVHPETQRRLTIVEVQQANGARMIESLKVDLSNRLDRMEKKLDKALHNE